MEQRAIWPAQGLEVRQQGKAPVIRGLFPYGALAVMSDRGKVRKERFAPRAFSYVLEDEPDREVSFLLGHSFDRPLASRKNGSLVLRDSDDALTFEATIDPDLLDVTHVRDALAMLAAGLVKGISPGFRVPPKDVVPDNERLDPEPGNPGVFIRTLLAVVLFELSLVCRPAYEASQAELRAMQSAHPVRSTTQGGVYLP